MEVGGRAGAVPGPRLMVAPQFYLLEAMHPPSAVSAALLLIH